MRKLGAEVILHGDSFDDASAEAKRLQLEEGRTLVHPFDDPLVIAGQGTIAMEVLKNMMGKPLDAIFCCVVTLGLELMKLLAFASADSLVLPRSIMGLDSIHPPRSMRCCENGILEYGVGTGRWRAGGWRGVICEGAATGGEGYRRRGGGCGRHDALAAGTPLSLLYLTQTRHMRAWVGGHSVSE